MKGALNIPNVLKNHASLCLNCMTLGAPLVLRRRFILREEVKEE